jgi:heat shock protein HslJ
MRHRSLWLLALALLLPAAEAALAAEDAGPAAQRGLQGKRWVWTGFTAPDAGALVPPRAEDYWVEFLPHGQLAIQADCNRGTGKWTLAGATLHLTPLAMTLRMCPGDSLDSRFLALLQRTSHFRRHGRTLQLELEGPSAVLGFTALAGPTPAP